MRWGAVTVAFALAGCAGSSIDASATTVPSSNINVGNVVFVDPASGSVAPGEDAPREMRNRRLGLYAVGVTVPDPVRLANAFCEDADGTAIGEVAFNNQMIDPGDRLGVAALQQLTPNDANPIVFRSTILGNPVDVEFYFRDLGTTDVCLESVTASDPSLQKYVGPDQTDGK